MPGPDKTFEEEVNYDLLDADLRKSDPTLTQDEINTFNTTIKDSVKLWDGKRLMTTGIGVTVGQSWFEKALSYIHDLFTGLMNGDGFSAFGNAWDKTGERSSLFMAQKAAESTYLTLTSMGGKYAALAEQASGSAPGHKPQDGEHSLFRQIYTAEQITMTSSSLNPVAANHVGSPPPTPGNNNTALTRGNGVA